MTDEKIRLLICHTCDSIDELPYYEGPPEHDDTLNYRVAEHRFPDGNEHFGIMATVPKEDWDKPSHRSAIIDKIAVSAGKPGSAAGFGETYYDIKSNFQADAMNCWVREHNRTENCEDYRSEKKRLLPPTKADRKEAGLPARRPNTFLCDFCPYQQIVQDRKNKSEGYY